jgi:hypothetical protein
MARRTMLCAWLLVGTPWFIDALRADCVREPRKPVKVAGALCGQVADITGGLLPDAQLYLLNESNVWVAGARGDSGGRFRFDPVPKGRYHLESSEGLVTDKVIEITGTNDRSCRQPVTVYIGLSDMTCSGGWISRGWDYKTFPDGPPRKP